jgi:hypothetical protein
MKFEQLYEFRQLAYECLGNAKDATFELADAPCTYPQRAHLRASTHRFTSRHTCWYRSGV